MALEYLLEIGVLVALAMPELRAAASAAYRRVFPFDAARIGGAAVVYLGLVASVALYEPRWLRIPALAASVALTYSLWRRRPDWGVSRGLPPGSLERLPIRPWSDPEFYARQAARYGNVFKMSQFGRPMVCIVGLERANRLLRDHDADLAVPPLPFNRFIAGGYLRYQPADRHAVYRRQFNALFHSDVISRAEPRVRAAFVDGLTAMAVCSARDGAVRVRTPLMRMMFAAWSDLFFGIDASHSDFSRLKALYRVIDIRRARWSSRRRIAAALVEIEAILRRRAAATGGDEGAPASFLAWMAAREPEALADRTALGNLVYIMQVTWGDVTGLLLWVFKMLTDHPEWRERLRHEPTRDLAERIVQETLRLEQSESRYRRALRDLEVDGVRIPKNWLVRICVRESHRDESIFPTARAFDPDRFVSRTYTRAEYAPLGAFHRACIGDDVTKAVTSLFALELVSQFDWEIAEDGPDEISSWAHNAPNRRFAVRIVKRVAAG
jgi:cytochrome P450